MARTRKKSANRRQTEPTKHGDGFPEDTEESTTLVTTSQAARIAGVSPSTIVRNRAELGATGTDSVQKYHVQRFCRPHRADFNP